MRYKKAGYINVQGQPVLDSPGMYAYPKVYDSSDDEDSPPPRGRSPSPPIDDHTREWHTPSVIGVNAVGELQQQLKDAQEELRKQREKEENLHQDKMKAHINSNPNPKPNNIRMELRLTLRQLH